jgi:hypothetical protein
MGFSNRPRRWRNRVLVAVAGLSGALVIGGCGASSKSSPVNAESRLAMAGLKFASCMRSHGVTNFPDPTASAGGVSISLRSTSGINPASPAFQAAQSACGGLEAVGGVGSQKPSPGTESEMLATSQCMRAHGVTGFPDPTTTPPGNPAGYSGVMTRNGVSFAIPATVDIQSPAVRQAASACNLGGLGQGGIGGGSP